MKALDAVKANTDALFGFAKDLFAVILSGDGGWANIDRDVGDGARCSDGDCLTSLVDADVVFALDSYGHVHGYDRATGAKEKSALSPPPAPERSASAQRLASRSSSAARRSASSVWPE